MLIDDYLPRYDFSEIHSININASPETVYRTLFELDLAESFIIRTLFRLRGMPANAMTLPGLLKMGFIPLGEKPNEEMLLGIIGRFWKASGDLQKCQPDDFQPFEKPGFAKAVWNFSLAEAGASGARLTTETRIFCTDPESRKKFRRYWRIIAPFSAWTRRDALRIIGNTVLRN